MSRSIPVVFACILIGLALCLMIPHENRDPAFLGAPAQAGLFGY